jgi:RNA polymerase sigma factor (sigma-70 family)
VDDFGDFYAARKDLVFRVLLAAGGDRLLAEDAAAEAFARAYARWSKLRDHPDPTAWVIRTGLNAQRTWWRRLRREVLGPPPHRSLPPAEPGGISAEVRAAVAALPRRQREVVALRLVADYSGEQVARLLGISTSAVGAHLHRALARLRATLRSLEPQREPADLKETL